MAKTNKQSKIRKSFNYNADFHDTVERCAKRQCENCPYREFAGKCRDVLIADAAAEIKYLFSELVFGS